MKATEIVLICLTFLTLIFTAFYTFYRVKNLETKSILTKTLAAYFFVLIGLFSTMYKFKLPYFPVFIISGLMSSFVGDLFLRLRNFMENKKFYFLFGGAFFSIAHMFYYMAIESIHPFTPFPLILGALLSLLVGLYFTFNKNFGEMGAIKIVFPLYLFLVFAMSSKALFLSISSPSFFSILLFVGSVFFALSDATLAQVYFSKKSSKKVAVFSTLTYFFSQILIALSIVLFTV